MAVKDLYDGERFAIVAYPDEQTLNLVRKNWAKYGIK